MKTILQFLILFLTIFLTSCGHTMYHKVEGTGVYGRIPLPNGASLVEVALGDINITTTALRGGASLDENTSKGGTFGTVSLGRHTTLMTEPAMNEGNIKDVLLSKDTDEKTKQLIAQYLITRKQSNVPSSAVTSINSAAATGDKSSIPQAIPTKTGIDNAVDKVTEVAPKVVEPIANNTAKVISDISNDIEEGTTSVIGGFWETVKSIKTLIISIIGIAIVILICVYFIKKKTAREE